jgi:hypothetical protein
MDSTDCLRSKAETYFNFADNCRIDHDDFAVYRTFRLHRVSLRFIEPHMEFLTAIRPDCVPLRLLWISFRVFVFNEHEIPSGCVYHVAGRSLSHFVHQR